MSEAFKDAEATVLEADREALTRALHKQERERENEAQAALHGVELALRDCAKRDLAAVERAAKRKRWRADPAAWASERLGVFLWSKQVEVLESIRDHRRTAVQSAHEIGKSFTAAVAIAWWIDIHKPGEAFVVTSAPTRTQVRSILWREIGRLHSRGTLPGRVNQTEWWIPIGNGREELVAFGRKPDDYSPTAFQGIHAAYVLYVFDEACGMPTQLWEAADSLIANDTGKALAIGNPDDPTAEFAKVCKPGSAWFNITISAFDSPNFTYEPVPDVITKALIGRISVEELRKKWAPDWRWVNAEGTPCEAESGVRVEPPPGGGPQDSNPLWQSKVLGLFPENAGGPDSLLPISWVRSAQTREIKVELDDPAVLGVDVGGGGNRSVFALAKGTLPKGLSVRIVRRDQNPDTMQTCGNMLADIVIYKARIAHVDMIGIGRGLVDRASELGKPVKGINVANEAREREAFINLRAEGYWHLRELFEHGQIDIPPDDDDLVAQLVDLRFKRRSNGKIEMESKDEVRRRTKSSPDEADAVMLSCLPDGLSGPSSIEEREASWG
jgi:hypothetical protein